RAGLEGVPPAPESAVGGCDVVAPVPTPGGEAGGSWYPVDSRAGGVVGGGSGVVIDVWRVAPTSSHRSPRVPSPGPRASAGLRTMGCPSPQRLCRGQRPEDTPLARLLPRRPVRRAAARRLPGRRVHPARPPPIHPRPAGVHPDAPARPVAPRAARED